MGPQIITFIQIFPLLFPVWEQRPITSEDTIPGPYPVIVNQRDISLQLRAFRDMDRDLRARISSELRQTGVREAYDVLVQLLPRETDPKVRNTLLEQIRMMPFTDEHLETLVRPYVSADDEDTRYWAVSLYGELPNADLTVLMKTVSSDLSEIVREAAMEALSRMPGRIKFPFYQNFWSDRNPRIAALAVVAAVQKPDIAANRDELIRIIQESSVETRAMTAAHLNDTDISVQKELARILRKDPHATVRAGLADTLGAIADRQYLPMLIAMLQDKDPEVRRQTAVRLSVFPQSESAEALVPVLADPRTLVRQAAENSLVILNASLPIPELVAPVLKHREAVARYHACRILGRVNARTFVRNVAALLPGETVPANLEAVTFALGQLGASFAATDIAARAKLEAAGVRREVAAALGLLNVPSTYGTLPVLAFDADDDVRQAAIVAMGRIGDGKAFSGTLLKVLQSVNSTNMSSRNRNAATWSAGRLVPVNADLVQRLVLQATTPVVPGEMGEMLFEEDPLLVSAAFAAVRCALQDPGQRPAAEKILEAHSRIPAPDAVPEDSGVLTPSAEVLEFSRQARAKLEGSEVTPGTRPTSAFSFSYGYLAEERK